VVANTFNYLPIILNYFAPPQELQLLLKPISDKISEVQEMRERNRRSEMFNHLSAISESISALGENCTSHMVTEAEVVWARFANSCEIRYTCTILVVSSVLHSSYKSNNKQL
jgi:hypothetical protein